MYKLTKDKILSGGFHVQVVLPIPDPVCTENFSDGFVRIFGSPTAEANYITHSQWDLECVRFKLHVF